MNQSQHPCWAISRDGRGEPANGPRLAQTRRRCRRGLWTLLSAVLAGTSLVDAATFTVTTTDDDGPGSLRQVILDANAQPGLDEIRFDIPGDGVHTIHPLTPPPIVTDPVDIDGYTQPGAAVATATSSAVLLIELSGERLPGGTNVNGITLGSGSSGSCVRGLSINRFARVLVGTGNCIYLSGGGHWIAGNYLNLAPDGRTIFTDTPSVGDGVYDNGTGGNLIGHDPSGPNQANPAADRNLMSGAGPGRVGVLVLQSSSHNQIRGNYMGVDASGSLALSNGWDGIQLQSAGNLVEHNLTSGNGRFGVSCFFPGGNVVRDNLIGTDASGTLLLGNATHGVLLYSPNNHVENNLISANGRLGILLSTYTNNIIEWNKIGTDVTGTLGLGNASSGLHLSSSGHNLIRDNLISGNGENGIAMYYSQSNTVTGNKVGTDISGTLALGNRGAAGVLIHDEHASNLIGSNLIGGLGKEDGNTIAFNPAGVVVVGINHTGNTIWGNSIFGNDGPGIDLGGDGVTPNDPWDADVGANHLQNFPVIDGAKSFRNPARVQVSGKLNSRPNRSYLIQVFTNAFGNPSGYGEGQQLLGNVRVHTDAAGHAKFHLSARESAAVGSNLTATATDWLTGDTSEFSQWQNGERKGSPASVERRQPVGTVSSRPSNPAPEFSEPAVAAP